MAMGEMGSSSRALFDRDLKKLHEDVIRLGDMIASAISQSMRALRKRDAVLATSIIEQDADINNLRYAIEDACMGMIATQQPAAGDLRAIVAAMNMSGDLERMGDHAAGIAKIVLRINEKGLEEFPRSLTQMAELVCTMLSQAMQAYARREDELAYKVASMDNLIDEHYHALYQELVEMMINKSEMTTSGVYLMFVGHNLERIADRATNLAERVVFMTSGTLLELNPEPGMTDTN